VFTPPTPTRCNLTVESRRRRVLGFIDLFYLWKLHSAHCCCTAICSFHVGSDCYDATAFTAAVISARAVFDMAEAAGFHFNLLDIGGGFPGQASAKPSFDEVILCSYVIIPGNNNNYN